MATVDSEQQGAGYSQRPRYDGPAQNQNQNQAQGSRDQAPNQDRPAEDRFTYEKMLESPCKYHTLNPRRPADHKTKDCSWHARTLREGAEGNNNSAPPRYPPRAPARQAPQATGSNAEAVRPNQATRPAGSWQENVNTVVGPNPAPPRRIQATSTTRSSTGTTPGQAGQMNTESTTRPMWCS